MKGAGPVPPSSTARLGAQRSSLLLSRLAKPSHFLLTFPSSFLSSLPAPP